MPLDEDGFAILLLSCGILPPEWLGPEVLWIKPRVPPTASGIGPPPVPCREAGWRPPLGCLRRHP